MQVAGVAPQSKIMGVSHSGLNPQEGVTANYAAGINWAWQHGADVINCSWGDQNGTSPAFYEPGLYHSPMLENAILNAMTLGRNGKGTMVIFSSGNVGNLDYPGNFHPDIITVGAVDQNGQRVNMPLSVNSAFGNQLDIVAPGRFILSTSLFNEVIYQNGTSMAAPHVAGIAALILSVNPAATSVTIGYKINEAASAYLMVLGGYGAGGTSQNYILDIENTQASLDLSGYPNGFYTVALVCDGQVVDAKTLVKQN